MRSNFLVALIAVTGIGVAARHSVSGGANAGTAPVPPARIARMAGLDRAHPVADEGAASYARAAVAAAQEPEGMALARAAASHGSRLLERAGKEGNGKRLLAEAAAHLKACLAFEVLDKRDPLFGEARGKLARVEELLARPVTLRAPRLHVEPKDTTKRTAPVLAEKPVRSGEAAMVGPDGVTFRREG